MIWQRSLIASALIMGCLSLEGQAHAAGTLLGASCASDHECDPDGLLCWLPFPELGWEGPAGGLCTAPCGTDEDCWAVDPAAVCLEAGFCAEGCVLGAEPETKCHGRRDVACSDFLGVEVINGLGVVQVFRDTAACAPRCAGDASCGIESFCNPATGLCSPEAPAGDEIGASCEPSDPTTCAGSCEDVCLEQCAMGRSGGCASTAAVSSLGAACLGSWFGGGVGDLGYCLPLCNCSSDCPDAMSCIAADLGDGYAAAGLCDPSPRAPGASDCIEDATGGGECPNGALRACKTADGCLGTAECLPSGEYGDCLCQEPANMSGAGGEAGASLGDVAAGGAGGDNDSTEEPPRQAVGDGSSCSSSGMPGPNRGWALGLGLLLCVGARWRRGLRRQAS